MPWPKGMPRKGYVNKDGKPHAAKGERLITIRVKPEPYKAIASPEPDRIEKTGPLPLIGMSNRPIVEPCLKCGWAYADGGWCENPNTNCNRGLKMPYLNPPNTVKSRLFTRRVR